MKALVFKTADFDFMMSRWTRAFKDCHVDFSEVVLDPKNRPSLQEQIKIIESVKPDFLFCQNLYAIDEWEGWGPPLEEVLEKFKIPLIGWAVDNPYSSGTPAHFWRLVTGPKFSRRILTLCIDDQFVRSFEAHGIRARFFLHSADRDYSRWANESQVSPLFENQITFAATPPPLHFLEDQPQKSPELGLIEQGMHRLLGVLKAHPQFRDHSSQQTLLAQQVFDLVSPHWYSFFARDYPKPEELVRARESLALRIKEGLSPESQISAMVQHGLRSIDSYYGHVQMSLWIKALRSSGLKVFGGEGWRKIFGDTETYPRLNPQELAASYRQSAVSFIFCKPSLPETPSERVLETFAAKGLPLHNTRKGMHRYFEDLEIPSYESLPQAAQKMNELKDHRGDFESLIQKGHEIVMEKHTFHQRVKELVAIIEAE